MNDKTVIRWAIVAAAVGSPAAAMLLYWFDPSEAGNFFPLCMLHYLTGLHCPCCGSTRCAHALVHGDMVQAAAWNPVTLVFFLAAIPCLFDALVKVIVGQPMTSIRVPLWLSKWGVIALLAFAVIRNLPFWPFELLAPHKL